MCIIFYVRTSQTKFFFVQSTFKFILPEQTKRLNSGKSSDTLLSQFINTKLQYDNVQTDCLRLYYTHITMKCAVSN